MNGWALKVRPDYTFDLEPYEPGLKYLQNAVDGYIERVTVQVDEFIYDMWVNEDGIARNLPINPYASHLYQLSTGSQWPILGSIVITGNDGTENTPGMTDEETSALLAHMTMWYIDTQTSWE